MPPALHLNSRLIFRLHLSRERNPHTTRNVFTVPEQLRRMLPPFFFLDERSLTGFNSVGNSFCTFAIEILALI
jgi:hypothetical protein